MLYKCLSLKELNEICFNTDNVMNMEEMFYEYTSLNNLNISKFNMKRGKKTKYMFTGSSKQLQELVKSQKNKIKKNVFYDHLIIIDILFMILTLILYTYYVKSTLNF